MKSRWNAWLYGIGYWIASGAIDAIREAKGGVL